MHRVHPLAASLARLGGRVHAARLAPPAAWLSRDELLGCAAQLDAVAAVATGGYDTDRPDILGTRFLEIWTWLVATPAAATVLLDRRLPDVSAASVVLCPGLWADPAPVGLRSARFWCLPADPAARHPDATVVADERALALELNAALRERHLAPLIDAVAERSRRARRALWRSATDQLVGAFARAGEAMGAHEEGCRLARLAAGGEPPMRGSGRIDRLSGYPLHVRDGCCLSYRLPDGPHCLSCPLLDEAERALRVAAGA
jgi:hypothetical protein